MSINKAAVLLFTTPSNVSKSVKALEDELGYSIFVRSNSGLLLTSIGAKFIQYATYILEDYEKLVNLSKEDSGNSFTVCYNQIPFVKRAFNHFCSLSQVSSCKLKAHQGNYWFCLDQLKQSRCQIAFLSFFSSGNVTYIKELENAGGEAIFLADANAAIVMRRSHPILQDRDIGTIEPHSLDRLIDYSYVNFSMPGYEQEILSPYQIGGDVWQINPNRMIDVNDMEHKRQLVENTNAYTFISTNLEKPTVSGNLVVIPCSLLKFRYYCAHRSKEPIDDRGQLLLECFQAEMKSPEIFVDF